MAAALQRGGSQGWVFAGRRHRLRRRARPMEPRGCAGSRVGRSRGGTRRHAARAHLPATRWHQGRWRDQWLPGSACQSGRLCRRRERGRLHAAALHRPGARQVGRADLFHLGCERGSGGSLAEDRRVHRGGGVPVGRGGAGRPRPLQELPRAAAQHRSEIGPCHDLPDRWQRRGHVRGVPRSGRTRRVVGGRGRECPGGRTGRGLADVSIGGERRG